MIFLDHNKRMLTSKKCRLWGKRNQQDNHNKISSHRHSHKISTNSNKTNNNSNNNSANHHKARNKTNLKEQQLSNSNKTMNKSSN